MRTLVYSVRIKYHTFLGHQCEGQESGKHFMKSIFKTFDVLFILHVTIKGRTSTIGFSITNYLSRNSEEFAGWAQDRCYIVRTVSTMLLLSSIPHPTFDDCVIPAKALVAKYPFLADASKDGRTSHLSYYSIANASLFITFILFWQFHLHCPWQSWMMQSRQLIIGQVLHIFLCDRCIISNYTKI